MTLSQFIIGKKKLEGLSKRLKDAQTQNASRTALEVKKNSKKKQVETHSAQG